MKKLILEARINEFTMRDPNPHVPWSVDEIVDTALACHAAGAAIIHFHARGPNGEPSNSYETYHEAVSRIKRQCDVMIHPTLGAVEVSGTPRERVANVLQLKADGLKPDLAPLDFASGNIDHLDPATHRYDTEDRVYINTTGALRGMAEILRENGVKPMAVTWHVPSLRQAIAFARNGTLDAPLFMQFLLSGGGSMMGHPPTMAGLEAFLAFLPDDIQVEWNILMHGASMLDLVEPVARRGGHLSLGLGDHHYAELGLPDNAGLIAQVATQVRDTGREIASPAEARALIGAI